MTDKVASPPRLVMGELIRATNKAIRWKLTLHESAEAGLNHPHCSICLESFKNPKDKVQELRAKLECGNVLGGLCIIKRINTNNSCPECRAKVFPSPVFEWYHEVGDQLIDAEGPMMLSRLNKESQDDALKTLDISRLFRRVMLAFMTLPQATVDEVAGAQKSW